MDKTKTNFPILENMSDEELDQTLAEALERANRGEGKPADVVFAEIRKKISN